MTRQEEDLLDLLDRKETVIADLLRALEDLIEACTDSISGGTCAPHRGVRDDARGIAAKAKREA